MNSVVELATVNPNLHLEIDIYDSDKEDMSSSMYTNSKQVGKKSDILSPKSSNISNMKFKDDVVSEWIDQLIKFHKKKFDEDILPAQDRAGRNFNKQTDSLEIEIKGLKKESRNEAIKTI